ncbi:UNVERIFIED_ORG: hypothetical protein ABIB63_004003 [Xanthomonas axonopodis]
MRAVKSPCDSEESRAGDARQAVGVVVQQRVELLGQQQQEALLAAHVDPLAEVAGRSGFHHVRDFLFHLHFLGTVAPFDHIAHALAVGSHDRADHFLHDAAADFDLCGVRALELIQQARVLGIAMELVDAGIAQCGGIEIGQVVPQDVLHFRQHALQRAIDVDDAALGVGDHHIGADVVQGGAHAQCFAGDQVVAFQARAQVIAHGARVEQQAAEFVMPVDFNRVVQAAGRHVAKHAFHCQQRAGDHLARGNEHHRDAQCKHHQREQQHAAHQCIQRAVDGAARLRADHRPLPRRVTLCGDFERLAGALGIAQLQVGAGLLAVQHRLQQGLLFGRHQCRQRGRGAGRGRNDLALVIARRHVDDDEIAVLAQFGGADLGLERGQALGIVAPDEQRTDDLAGGIAQRLVMGHVLLAE